MADGDASATESGGVMNSAAERSRCPHAQRSSLRISLAASVAEIVEADAADNEPSNASHEVESNGGAAGPQKRKSGGGVPPDRSLPSRRSFRLSGVGPAFTVSAAEAKLDRIAAKSPTRRGKDRDLRNEASDDDDPVFIGCVRASGGAQDSEPVGAATAATTALSRYAAALREAADACDCTASGAADVKAGLAAPVAEATTVSSLRGAPFVPSQIYNGSFDGLRADSRVASADNGDARALDEPPACASAAFRPPPAGQDRSVEQVAESSAADALADSPSRNQQQQGTSEENDSPPEVAAIPPPITGAGVFVRVGAPAATTAANGEIVLASVDFRDDAPAAFGRPLATNGLASSGGLENGAAGKAGGGVDGGTDPGAKRGRALASHGEYIGWCAAVQRSVQGSADGPGFAKDETACTNDSGPADASAKPRVMRTPEGTPKVSPPFAGTAALGDQADPPVIVSAGRTAGCSGGCPLKPSTELPAEASSEPGFCFSGASAAKAESPRPGNRIASSRRASPSISAIPLRDRAKCTNQTSTGTPIAQAAHEGSPSAPCNGSTSGVSEAPAPVPAAAKVATKAPGEGQKRTQPGETLPPLAADTRQAASTVTAAVKCNDKAEETKAAAEPDGKSTNRKVGRPRKLPLPPAADVAVPGGAVETEAAVERSSKPGSGKDKRGRNRKGGTIGDEHSPRAKRGRPRKNPKEGPDVAGSGRKVGRGRDSGAPPCQQGGGESEGGRSDDGAGGAASEKDGKVVKKKATGRARKKRRAVSGKASAQVDELDKFLKSFLLDSSHETPQTPTPAIYHPVEERDESKPAAVTTWAPPPQRRPGAANAAWELLHFVPLPVGASGVEARCGERLGVSAEICNGRVMPTGEASEIEGAENAERELLAEAPGAGEGRRREFAEEGAPEIGLGTRADAMEEAESPSRSPQEGTQAETDALATPSTPQTRKPQGGQHPPQDPTPPVPPSGSFSHSPQECTQAGTDAMATPSTPQIWEPQGWERPPQDPAPPVPPSEPSTRLPQEGTQAGTNAMATPSTPQTWEPQGWEHPPQDPTPPVPPSKPVTPASDVGDFPVAPAADISMVVEGIEGGAVETVPVLASAAADASVLGAVGTASDASRRGEGAEGGTAEGKSGITSVGAGGLGMVDEDGTAARPAGKDDTGVHSGGQGGDDSRKDPPAAEPSTPPSLPPGRPKDKGKGRAGCVSSSTATSKIASELTLKDQQDEILNTLSSGRQECQKNLIEPQEYGGKGGYFEQKSQPFEIQVHPNVLFVADAHSYMVDSAEVCGVLAGRRDKENGVLHIQAAVPVLEEQRGGGDKGHTEVTMSSLDLFRASQGITNLGMQMVGWYHSHPKFNNIPSPIDVSNQNDYQNLYERSDGGEGAGTWVGLIVGRAQSPSNFLFFRNEKVEREDSFPVACPMLLQTRLLSSTFSAAALAVPAPLPAPSPQTDTTKPTAKRPSHAENDEGDTASEGGRVPPNERGILWTTASPEVAVSDTVPVALPHEEVEICEAKGGAGGAPSRVGSLEGGEAGSAVDATIVADAREVGVAVGVAVAGEESSPGVPDEETPRVEVGAKMTSAAVSGSAMSSYAWEGPSPTPTRRSPSPVPTPVTTPLGSYETLSPPSPPSAEHSEALPKGAQACVADGPSSTFAVGEVMMDGSLLDLGARCSDGSGVAEGQRLQPPVDVLTREGGAEAGNFGVGERRRGVEERRGGGGRGDGAAARRKRARELARSEIAKEGEERSKRAKMIVAQGNRPVSAEMEPSCSLHVQGHPVATGIARTSAAYSNVDSPLAPSPSPPVPSADFKEAPPQCPTDHIADDPNAGATDAPIEDSPPQVDNMNVQPAENSSRDTPDRFGPSAEQTLAMPRGNAPNRPSVATPGACGNFPRSDLSETESPPVPASTGCYTGDFMVSNGVRRSIAASLPAATSSRPGAEAAAATVAAGVATVDAPSRGRENGGAAGCGGVGVDGSARVTKIDKELQRERLLEAVGAMATEPPLVFSEEVLRVLTGGEASPAGAVGDANGDWKGYGPEMDRVTESLMSLGRYYARATGRAPLKWEKRPGVPALVKLARSLLQTVDHMELLPSETEEFVEDACSFLLACFRETRVMPQKRKKNAEASISRPKRQRRNAQGEA